MHLCKADFSLSGRIKASRTHEEGTINDTRKVVWEPGASTAAVLPAGGEGSTFALTSVKPETWPLANGLLTDGAYTSASDTGCPFMKYFPDS